MVKDIELFIKEIRKKISTDNDFDFESIAREIYLHQKYNNKLFGDFIANFEGNSNYYFLPIAAFKHHAVKTGNWQAQRKFESSGTTTSLNSVHYIRDMAWYNQVTRVHFEKVFGRLDQQCILALLPHYLEKGNSSLVAMVDHFITNSAMEDSGFYLNEHEKLKETILRNEAKNVPTVLFGVTYALLDFIKMFGVEQTSMLTIIETGGMKGRGRELTREELHRTVSKHFVNAKITSEYGMTELLSQAYLSDDGWFYPGKTMKVVVTEINDPFQEEKTGKTGVINIIDLANVDTCSFIKTDDLGRSNSDGGFQVMGRLDYSDLRGCNLMIQDL